MFKSALSVILLGFFLCPAASVMAESGPDNGTDAIKILFAEAHETLKLRFRALDADQVREMEMASDLKQWLLRVDSQKIPQWESLRFHLEKIRLEFQTKPCQDSQGRTASICYFNDNPQDPFVLVSLQENRGTDLHRAMAMLIHEAGHFAGEKDHLFLDRLGVVLVQALQDPKVFSVSVSSTELAGNVFWAKDQCERGQSQQALNLLARAKADLTQLCLEKRKECDFSKLLPTFQGNIEFRDGAGFTMNVTCILRAVLPL